MSDRTSQAPVFSSNPLPVMPESGLRYLTEERDACGVGFIAQRQAQASHDLVEKALIALGCMEHRGGCSADRDSGDGAGVMTAIPWTLIEQWAATEGKTIDRDRTAVGMLFLPLDADKLAKTKAAIDAPAKLSAW